ADSPVAFKADTIGNGAILSPALRRISVTSASGDRAAEPASIRAAHRLHSQSLHRSGRTGSRRYADALALRATTGCSTSPAAPHSRSRRATSHSPTTAATLLLVTVPAVQMPPKRFHSHAQRPDGRLAAASKRGCGRNGR